MRLVKVSAPKGNGADVAKIAFNCGILEVSTHQVQLLEANGNSEVRDIIDLNISTPKAKRFVDALLAADFYKAENYTVNIRQPRSIISRESLRQLTVPVAEPATDILEELWQFSHITSSFVGRIFIAACLLAYGVIESKLLIIIAGLLFLPLLPLLLSVSFGLKTGKRQLAAQGALAFLTAVILLFFGGIFIALLSHPPIKFNEFNSLAVSFLISVGIGIAAVLANIDDAGRRELIGLAATAQIAIIPVWFGICVIFGFPATTDGSEINTRAMSFIISILTVIITSLVFYIVTGAANGSISHLKEK